jgi:hypothetical protein
MAATGKDQGGVAAGRWPVRPSRGGPVGLAAAAALLVSGAFVLGLAARQPLGGLPVLGILIAGALIGAGTLLGLLARGYYRLAYRFDPGALVIESAGVAETIPLASIEGIYAGQRAGPVGAVRGVSWPGYYVGLVRSRSLGSLWIFGTDRSESSLSVVVTAARTYLLTPVDPPEFRRELIRRIEANNVAADLVSIEPTAVRGAIRPPLVVGFFVVGGAFLLASVATLLSRYGGLPDQVLLPDELIGRLAGIRPKSDLLGLPLLGGAIFFVNAVLAALIRRRQRAGMMLLGGTSCLAELLLLLATMRLLG